MIANQSNSLGTVKQKKPVIISTQLIIYRYMYSCFLDRLGGLILDIVSQTLLNMDGVGNLRKLSFNILLPTIGTDFYQFGSSTSGDNHRCLK
jgi:hypothetical protein